MDGPVKGTCISDDIMVYTVHSCCIRFSRLRIVITTIHQRKQNGWLFVRALWKLLMTIDQI